MKFIEIVGFKYKIQETKLNTTATASHRNSIL